MVIRRKNMTDRAKFVARARQNFAKNYRNKLLKEHENCVVLVDGRSGDFEVQSASEPRFRARARMLDRRPDADIVIEHMVADDFTYSAPATVVHND